MEQEFGGISCAFYTVKQLSALFGKSEDTIRRWKNEGIGREEDNIKLRAIEREDGRGRKNARHLVFSREAVIDFVRANPFLMDDAPQLSMMMQAEGAWNGGAIPLPGNVKSDDDSESLYGAVPPRYKENIGSRAFSERDGACFVRDEADNELPRFERRPRRPVPPPPFEEEEEDVGFLPKDAEDFLDRLRRESFGSSEVPPRRRRGREADPEIERRLKSINYALRVLRERVMDMEKERLDLDAALTDLELSGMNEKNLRPIKAIAKQRMAELSEQIDMLEEFIELIEEELD